MMRRDYREELMLGGVVKSESCELVSPGMTHDKVWDE